MNRPARITLAALSGVLLALAFPHMAWGWLALVALTPLIVSATRASGKLEAFLLGWVAITITWLINLPWVVIVMSQYGGLSRPIGMGIFIAMCCILGCYGGLFALAIRLLNLGPSFLPWLAIPALWIALEYARTFLLSGFPWHLIATALVDLPQLVQPARWVGPYGMGLPMVAISAALAFVFAGGAPRRNRVVASVGTFSFLVIWMVVGGVLLRRQVETIRAETKFVGAMVQPNISQQMRWDESQLGLIFDRMVALTRQGFAAGATVVVWPESTLPLTFYRTPFYRSYIESTSRQFDGDIILGSVAEDPVDSNKLWNAAYLVSRGTISGRYDKLRLVPFGEYVPLRKMLFFAEKLVRAVGDFQFGTNEFPLTGKFRYGPAICYEVVYPRIPANQTRNGAEVLVTITNDAWFDRSAAPRQHLNHVRLRAVETDRYFLRAATTGISALIDPTGRIVTELDLEKEGVIVGEFGARQSRTPYVRFGDWPAWLSIAVSLVTLGNAFRGNNRELRIENTK